ncbi:MAG: arylsulfatase [Microcystis aeruginosa Ma_AC_P_19900807_S299]|jgi:arylsulfatase|nr:MAG: arylsulfatase [Microcystis aeruginosa Ma_AC_P_19900807_S299]
MTKEFNGTIALDIRDSVPDWEPYAEPKAPEGSPNILYLVIDDTGFGAWEMFGGKIKMPNLSRIAKKGLVYTNFHTTALCSPTRSSLLNGRNATSNGMSCIEEATTGFPGSNGRIPFENAMIPAVLGERGWNTFALGKWHLLPEEEANMAASKRNWPLGRGFERYYGFLGGETDQWYPDLVYDNHLIEPPYGPDLDDTENGYHLSKDLVDKAISFIQDTTAIAPKKPWMMYFSPGANHAPHQIWPEMILKYEYNTTLGDKNNPEDTSFIDTSVFKDGYEEYRKQVLANMKALGIFDGDLSPATINPHNEGVLDKKYDGELTEKDIIGVPPGKAWPSTDYVRPWGDLDQKEKALFIRMAEIYAAFSTYTDEQIGRLLDFLEKTGQMDNTIIIAVSDNGASAEGGPNGSVNENLFFNGVEDNVDKNFALLQALGTEKTYNHYPSGWAWAFDTPFKYWKRWSGYEGGAATPFMMCGPGIGITEKENYEYRKQYIHAVDLVPTLYELVNIEPPAVVKGYTQNPIEGISFAYTFHPNYGQPEYQFPYKDDALKPKDENGKLKKVRETQFYSMLGTRGVWYKGWHACTVHAPTPSDWSNFELDTWELYCMDGDEWKGKLGRTHRVKADPTQSRNLATVYPRKLERLKNMWFVQAGIYNGVPLDDRSTTEILSTPRPQLADPPDFSGEGDWPEDEFGYIYYPGGSEIPEAVAPNIRTRSYSITATVDFSSGDTPEGVLLAHGGRFGGHSFYIHENRLCYVYNWLGQREQKVSCSLPNNLSGEVVKLKVEFAKTGMLQNDPKFGSSTVGNVSLFISDMDTPVTPIEHNLDSFEDTQKGKFLTQPSKFALSGEGFNIGRDAGQPVSHDYATHIPYEFEGAILKNVVVAIKNDAAAADHDKEFRGMLWRD